ncbi:MAG: AI-2E family transporter [Geminicoccaceae bacterium]
MQPPPSPPPDYGGADFGWRVVETTLIVVVVLLLAGILWFAADVLMLLFAAVLIATLLRAATNGLVHLTGLADGWSLAIVILVVTGGLLVLGVLLAPRVASQVPQLVTNLGGAIEGLEKSLGLGNLAAELTKDLRLRELLPSPAGILGGATGIISSSFGTLANAVIVVVLGIYLAGDPDLYIRGVARLMPPNARQGTRELLEEIGHALRWWMVGQLISMTAVGVLSYIGLSLLGVPLALSLALVAFFMTFIPFIGPTLTAIPVVLVAFSKGPDTALYAFVLYVAIEMFEGYVLTPNVQRRSVSLPPALTIAAQVLIGVLLGALGVALATPLAAAGLVAVNRLYVEDILGESPEKPAEAEASRSSTRQSAAE